MKVSEFDNLEQRHKRGEAIYIGDHTLLARTVFGKKIFLDSRDLSVTPHIALDGVWERWITRAMLPWLRPGIVALDIGANVGFFALLMASEIGSEGRVQAIEANPRLADLCRRSINVNGFDGWASCSCVALWDSPGVMSLRMNNQLMGSATVVEQPTGSCLDDAAETVKVSSVKLDDLVAGKPVDFMKIDCEGAEPQIIAGGRATLSANERLSFFMEYTPARHRAGGDTVAMLDQLAEMKYRLFVITHASMYRPVTRDWLLNLSGYVDLLVTRRDQDSIPLLESNVRMAQGSFLGRFGGAIRRAVGFPSSGTL